MDAEEYVGRNFEAEGEMFEVDEEMAEAVQTYVDFVREMATGADRFTIEHRFDLSSYHPKFFGTADCVIYHAATKTLHVIDYKHGKGVPVDPEENEQLMYYGLGALATFGVPVVDVVLTIVQPRCDHAKGPIRTWATDSLTLAEWGADLVEAARRTEDPEAPLHPGSWCKFCAAAAVCPALREKVLSDTRADFDDSGDIHLSEPKSFGMNSLADILHNVDMIEDWCQRVREYAHARALEGDTIPGYKLVSTRPRRSWANESAMIETMEMLAFGQDELYTKKLKSPAQMEKMLGKSKTLLEQYVQRISKGTVLAKEDDKRPEFKDAPVDEFDPVLS